MRYNLLRVKPAIANTSVQVTETISGYIVEYLSGQTANDLSRWNGGGLVVFTKEVPNRTIRVFAQDKVLSPRHSRIV